MHPNIKFTATYDVETRAILFLDMVIRIDDNGYFETDLYKRETAIWVTSRTTYPTH